MPSGIENYRGILRETLGELASRLGSPDTFDRRGSVLWIDSFEDGIQKWTILTDGLATWNAEVARTGGFSLKLVTPAAPSFSYISTVIPYHISEHMGFEFSIKVPVAIVANGDWSETSNLDYLICYSTLFDGTNSHMAGVKWLFSDKSWYYYDGDFHPFSPEYLMYSINTIHTLKLVVDFKAEEYLRFLVENFSYTMDGIKYKKEPSTHPPRLEFMFIVRNAGGAATIYFDDIIVTRDEPANPVV